MIRLPGYFVAPGENWRPSVRRIPAFSRVPVRKSCARSIDQIRCEVLFLDSKTSYERFFRRKQIQRILKQNRVFFNNNLLFFLQVVYVCIYRLNKILKSISSLKLKSGLKHLDKRLKTRIIIFVNILLLFLFLSTLTTMQDSRWCSVSHDLEPAANRKTGESRSYPL